MTLQIKRRTFTVDEYQVMLRAGILTEDDRVELLDGELANMTPIGSSHAACVDRLTRILTSLLGQKAIARIQNPVRLSELSEPQPDVTLLVPRPDFYSSAHPGPRDVYLLIEVADTTGDYDRQVKLPLYAGAGISEVWLVDLAARQVEVYREPSQGSYRTTSVTKAGQRLSPLAFPELALDAKDILG